MRSVPLRFVLSALALLPGALNAQAESEGDPFSSVLFTAEEVMQHRRAIGLNDEQRDAITHLIEELQGRAVGLQWRLLDETESVREALEAPRVDLDRVMEIIKDIQAREEVQGKFAGLKFRSSNRISHKDQEILSFEIGCPVN